MSEHGEGRIMPRWPHGIFIDSERVEEADDALAEGIGQDPLASFRVKPVDLRRFDFLFPELQEDPDNLLPVSQDTVDNLVALGNSMAELRPLNIVGQPNDPDKDPSRDARFSAALTYFGQFVDHDITLDQSATPGTAAPAPEGLVPLELEVIREGTKNLRTGVLELDSVYGKPAPKDPNNPRKMKIGNVTTLPDPAPPQVRGRPLLRPPGKADANDLPREPRNEGVFVHDRAALIGDPRNDENTIISQLHVAFLRAHNKLVNEAAPPNRFKKAKRRLLRHYQYIVLHDFLKQIVGSAIVRDTIKNGNRVFDPDEDEFFMPLEFAVAAYRFGHSMVRSAYDFNLNFNKSGEQTGPNDLTTPATLDRLFTFTALSGQLGGGQGSNTLPENWIIEWENFFDPQGKAGLSKARRIDTELADPLTRLKNIKGELEGSPPENLAAKLAVRNLLRGYLLRMPTGQAVARALRKKLRGVRDIPVLTPQQIEENAKKFDEKQAEVGQATVKQAEVLQRRQGELLRRTPLWYYILAEAAILRNGQSLGPVGGTIVAEVLVGLVRRSPHSILAPGSDWEPNLPSEEPGEFTLPDLLRFARVLA
jgi:hypothetical protein